MQIPPQMMFLHQGQDNIKEMRFHPQYGCLMTTTAEDSFNIFRPNLEPVESGGENDDAASDQDMAQAQDTEETKQDSSAAEETKMR